MGRELAARLGVPYVELDAVFHQPQWTPLPEESNLLTWDEQESVISWAWHHYPIYRERYTAATQDPRYAHLAFRRIATRADPCQL